MPPCCSIYSSTIITYIVDLFHPTTFLIRSNHNNARLGRYVHAFLSHSPHPCCATFHVGIDLNDVHIPAELS